MLARLLSMLDWKTDYAPDGTTALEKATEHPPALIILDLLIPGISGFEIVARLKYDEHLKHIPIVIMSSLGADNVLLRLGVAGVLPKGTFTRDRLYQALNGVIPLAT